MVNHGNKFIIFRVDVDSERICLLLVVWLTQALELDGCHLIIFNIVLADALEAKGSRITILSKVA